MKTNRQDAILRIINTREIETQEELAEALRELGFKVTQATVSRDIRALNMTKVTGRDGRSHYAILQDQPSVMGEYS